MTAATIDAIDSWLPQTQCGQCSYPRCRQYAQAIARGDADINQCPPGNEITIQALASLLGVPAKPLNPSYGSHRGRTLAAIDEERCIGCTLCIQVCPVDAIVGANKFMHTVIADQCTGCELCPPACPVDCIDLAPPPPGDSHQTWRWPEFSLPQTQQAAARTEAQRQRLARQRRIRSRRNRIDQRNIKHELAAALSRARTRKQARPRPVATPGHG